MIGIKEAEKLVPLVYDSRCSGNYTQELYDCWHVCGSVQPVVVTLQEVARSSQGMDFAVVMKHL